MRDSEIRQSEAIARMNSFGVENAQDFAASSLGGRKFADLKALTEEIDRLGAQQSEGHGASQTGTEAKRAARNALRAAMRAISDTSEAMESTHPGISDTFRMPKNNSDEALLNAARAFVSSATPLKDEFIQYEMPATFIEDLVRLIADFESASGSRQLNTRKRVSATAALKDALERGMQLKRELDPIVRNKYRGNAAKLAAWESASHVERAPKRAAARPAQQPT